MTRLKQLLSDRSGVTLVEQIVCLVLMLIVAAVVGTLLSSSLSIMTRTRSAANAQSVSAILLDKMAGEIAGAQIGSNGTVGATVNYITVSKGTVSGNPNNVRVPGECEYISFNTRTGSPVYITYDNEGQMVMHYRAIQSNGSTIDATDWKFDKKMYMGFKITALQFHIMRTGTTETEDEGTTTNIIKISITLEHERSGYTYSAVRYAECYNFKDAASVSYIKYGAADLS